MIKLLSRSPGTIVLLSLLATISACLPAVDRTRPGEPVVMQLAQEFRHYIEAGNIVAANAMMTADSRRWFGRREGPGAHWALARGGAGPWANWDRHFASGKQVIGWRADDRQVIATVIEHNDYYDLLERGAVTNEIVYYFDSDLKIEGHLIRGVGDRPAGRTDEFIRWARRHAPGELAYLMPAAELDPSGDRPQRMRRLLDLWRAAEGLPDLGYDGTRAAMLDAYRAGDYAEADIHAARILRWRPNHPPTMFNRALLAALQGDREAMLAWLDRLARVGAHYAVRDQEPFAAHRDHPEFVTIAAKFAANATSPAASVPTYSLQRPDFIPEGLAYDAASGALFVGSIRRREVIRIGRDGAMTLFVAPAAHGLGSAMGMQADTRRNRLWVASAATPQMRPQAEHDETGVWEFRLDTGEFVARHLLPPAAAPQVIGDLLLAGDGRLFASESRLGGVYQLDPTSGAFSTVVEPGLLRSAQGMALSADGAHLYVADYAAGLHVVDIADHTLVRLLLPDDAHDYGIDGLYRDGDSLIAIQNLVAPQRVARFELAEDGMSVNAGRVLEAGLPDYSEPTLGVIVDGALLYIANSQWDRFTQENELPPLDELQPPVIRRLPLAKESRLH